MNLQITSLLSSLGWSRRKQRMEILVVGTPQKDYHFSGVEFQISQSRSRKFWAHNKDVRAAKGAPGSFFSFSATIISVKGSTNNVPGPPYSEYRNSLNIWCDKETGLKGVAWKLEPLFLSHSTLGNQGLSFTTRQLLAEIVKSNWKKVRTAVCLVLRSDISSKIQSTISRSKQDRSPRKRCFKFIIGSNLMVLQAITSPEKFIKILQISSIAFIYWTVWTHVKLLEMAVTLGLTHLWTVAFGSSINLRISQRNKETTAPPTFLLFYLENFFSERVPISPIDWIFFEDKSVQEEDKQQLPISQSAKDKKTNMMKYGYSPGKGKDETKKQPLPFLTLRNPLKWYKKKKKMHSQELKSKNTTEFQIPQLSLFPEKLKDLCR